MNTWPRRTQRLPLEHATLPPVRSKVYARHQTVLSESGKVTCASTKGQTKISSIKVYLSSIKINLSPSKITVDKNSMFASKQTKTVQFTERLLVVPLVPT